MGDFGRKDRRGIFWQITPRVLMEAALNKRSYIRLAALRSWLLGFVRTEVCLICDRTDCMVRLWVRLKADWFWDAIARFREELTDCLAPPSALSENDVSESL